MGNPQREALREGFSAAIDAFSDELLDNLTAESAYEQGWRAATYSVAPVLWAQLAGDRLDTTQVCGLLDISRQAVNKRLATGSLVGLPGRGTTYFPKWQFDIDQRIIRPGVQRVLSVLREALDGVDPYFIVSWMATPQPELGDLPPAEWVENGEPAEPLVKAATRTAATLR